MKYPSLFSILLLFGCQPDKNVAEGSAISISPDTQSTDRPENDERTIYYDFNGDGTLDRLQVVDNPGRDTDGMGMARDVVVSSMLGESFSEWYRSEMAILPASGGGMMGDPFQYLEFNTDRKLVSIHHHGGSRERWNYVHAYRFQKGDFELIIASVDIGTPCLDNESFDYMLSSGEAVYETATLDCEDESKPAEEVTSTKAWLAELDELPTMRSFRPGEIKMVVPSMGKTIFY